MRTLGIDVSKGKLDCCLMNLSRLGEEQSSHFQVENNTEGFRGIAEKIKAASSRLNGLKVVLEPTSHYHEAVAEWLYAKNCKVCLVNPADARYFAKSLGNYSKNDTIDAHILAYMGQKLELRLWEPPSEEVTILRSYYTRLVQTIQMRQREENRLEGHSREQQQNQADMITVENIEYYRSQEDRLLGLMGEYIQSIQAFSEDVQLLCSIPGIAFKTAVLLTVLFNTYAFQNSAQVAAFIGIVPREMKSGTSVHGGTHISKRGLSLFRAKLYMPTFTSILKSSDIGAFYERLLANGKSKQSAHCAVIQKLVKIAFSVWMYKTPYQDGFSCKAKRVKRTDAESPQRLGEVVQRSSKQVAKRTIKQVALTSIARKKKQVVQDDSKSLRLIDVNFADIKQPPSPHTRR